MTRRLRSLLGGCFVALCCTAMPAAGEAPLVPLRGQGGNGHTVSGRELPVVAGPHAQQVRAPRRTLAPDPVREQVRQAKLDAAAGRIALRQQGVLVSELTGQRARGGGQPDDGGAPLPLGDWLAHDENGAAPPDPHLAVGTEDLVATVNYHLTVFDKAGVATKASVSLFDWFASQLGGAVAGGPWQIWDPWVVYDIPDQRYVMVALAVNDSTQESRWLVSVSKGGRADGDWCSFSFDGRLDGATDSGLMIDYPKVGVSGSVVMFTATMADFPSNGGGLRYGKARIIEKAGLYDTTCPATVAYTDFINLTLMSGSPAYNVQPVHSQVGGVPVGYLLAASRTGGTELTMWMASVQVPGVPIVVRTGRVQTTNYSVPPDAVQAGSNTRLDTGDARLLGALLASNGRLWAAHTVACQWPGVALPVSCGRFYDIDPVNRTARQQVSFGAPLVWAYHPQIAANGLGAGDMMMVYTRSSPTLPPGARVIGRKRTDPLSTLRPGADLQAGSTCYVFLVNGANRWGDYQGMAIDPVQPDEFWAHGEYSGGTGPGCSTDWGTRLGRFRLP